MQIIDAGKNMVVEFEKDVARQNARARRRAAAQNLRYHDRVRVGSVQAPCQSTVEGDRRCSKTQPRPPYAPIAHEACGDVFGGIASNREANALCGPWTAAGIAAGMR
jgi:hypothetical protein